MLAERRYDIDWLRVIAIGLLLIYHIAIAFQPWGVLIGFIQTNDPMESVWIPMSMLNIWRIPLLFFVSGMGVWFAIQRRNWKQLLTERSKRILLPFLFGMTVIIPIHVFIWQDYYHQKLRYIFNPSHLWFLGNIFIYVLVLSPIFFFLKKNQGGRVHQMIKRFTNNSLGLLILMIPFILEAEIVSPSEFEVYAMTTHGFFLGLIAFLTGFLCVYSGSGFWEEVTKRRWVLLTIAVVMYFIRLLIFDLRTPNYLMAIESFHWIMAIFGFGYKHLNKPSHALSYLSQAAYPVYIIHMVFIYLGSWLFFQSDIHVIFQFVLLNIFTFAGSFITYEFAIRRAKILRPLFGLKQIDNSFDVSATEQQHDKSRNRKIEIQTMET
ncbi:acyltransferase family protein [Ekhidna sp.]|uniref:acyltransferase family protein n=1 Tax=Ekhidna sp. TaxID=2608089 RepID=UPI003BACF3F5